MPPSPATGCARWLTRDVGLLLAARALRMLACGALSVVFALHLSGLGFSPGRIGLVFTIALAGGAVTTTLVALVADRWGRRRWLLVSALAMTAAGAAVAGSDQFPVVLFFAALGVLSPSGQEVGPFQSLEQAALAQVLPDRDLVGRRRSGIEVRCALHFVVERCRRHPPVGQRRLRGLVHAVSPGHQPAPRGLDHRHPRRGHRCRLRGDPSGGRRARCASAAPRLGSPRPALR